jgi:hypothetical protein
MATSHIAATERELDTIAWRFLGSEFAGQIHSNWSIDRRVDAYLAHHGLIDMVNDTATYDALLEHVMANIAPALRTGVLPSPSR